MSLFNTLSRTLAVLALLLLAVLFAADKFTRLRGAFPLLHLFEPKGFTENEIPDLSNKYFIVTGGNSGLGYGTCQMLAQHGGNVILTSRNVKNGEAAKKEMGVTKGKITVMELDLSDLKSVKNFANEYKKLDLPLHSLILNAGVMAPPFELTKDGIESQFGVNHVAHFALTKDLLPVLESTEHSTVVSVSSLAHWMPVPVGVYLDLKKINDKSNYQPMAWYGQSKLANILFAKELARRSPKVMVNAAHPGGVQGKLSRYMVAGSELTEKIDSVVQHYLYWTPIEAALTSLRPAVSREIVDKKITGQYFVPIARMDPGSDLARDSDLARKLWDFTEDLLKQKGYDVM